jgi:oligopeptide transporter, OPT family
MGVVSALLKFGGIEFDYSSWWENHLSELLSLVAYAALILYFILATKLSKKELADQN